MSRRLEVESAERAWEELMEQIAEDSLSLSDAELENEVERDGLDARQQAESIRGLLLDEVQSFRQSKLRAALEEHAEAVLRLRNRAYELPQTPQERREMLSQLFGRFPQMQTFLTIQHRDFKSVSDTDVESFLKQLDELGVIEDLPPSTHPSLQRKQ